jgi:adenosylcobyric acid synthase
MSGALMIQGCGSDVGKSTLVAGLCRLYANRGLTVRPFKPQNMSNNAAVTVDGGEIGRAQALQAVACRTPPTVHMNPVLLKPQSDVGAQLIVRGKIEGNFTARAFQDRKGELLDMAVKSFRQLQAESDLVIVEGAGSPAEINLRQGDIANMGFARASDTPVVLVGDIDRGHVIAALVGAHAVLDAEDRAMIRGFLINKFRGDPSLFDDGRREIARRTGWADLGMAPWLAAARRLPAEDAVVLERARPGGAGRRARIVAPLLRGVSNFDDLDPLKDEPEVDFSFITPGSPLPGDADLVVLTGSKATLSDLAMLRREGWDIDILAHVRRGGRVLGLCGGYQMLGRRIADPGGMEGPAGEAAGLGLLDVATTLTTAKVLQPATGRLTNGGARATGYEMHIGETTGPGLARPFMTHDDGRPDGALSADERIAGTYLHGLFASGPARAALLAQLGAGSSGVDQTLVVDQALDEIAAVLAQHFNIDALSRIAGL